MNKKGSHVGVALSFGIFIIFLVFLLSALTPLIKTQESKQHILEDLKYKLMNLSSENLTTITLYISKDVDKDCVNIDGITNYFSGENLRVKNSLYEIIPYEIQNDSKLYIEVGDDFDGFLKIYLSDKITSSEEGINGCTPVMEGDYSIKVLTTREYYSDDGIIETIEKYNTNYAGLKEELGVPEGTDFGFNFTYSNRTMIGTEEEQASTSVYSDQSYMLYIDSDGNINMGYLTVRVW
ncbi:MAG: hypothetical protein KKF67_02360 [Nanoarchaeota archaeon]|nr:hypothetical protein [Nanoarchaeota archaeon]